MTDLEFENWRKTPRDLLTVGKHERLLRLVSAAPGLLDACRDLLGLIEGTPLSDRGDPDAAPVVAAARAAVSAAEEAMP